MVLPFRYLTYVPRNISSRLLSNVIPFFFLSGIIAFSSFEALLIIFYVLDIVVYVGDKETNRYGLEMKLLDFEITAFISHPDSSLHFHTLQISHLAFEN